MNHRPRYYQAPLVASLCLLGFTTSLLHDKLFLAIASPADARTSGPCLAIIDKREVVVENAKFGPCRGDGILISGSENILVRNVLVENTNGVGIRIMHSKGVRVTESTLRNGQSGVYAEHSEDIEIAKNHFYDVQGPKPRGQFVQFNEITGSSRISCNESRNNLGDSTPEDAINIFKSEGTQQSPILIDHNLIIGGGPSRSGGGIMLGDGGGAWLVARGNSLIDPGQYGIAVAGGSHMTIEDNTIFARRQDFTNVGVYVWNQSAGICSNIAVQGNAVNWTNRNGKKNSWWNGNNCTSLTVAATNRWDTPLVPKELEIIPAFCRTDEHNP